MRIAQINMVHLGSTGKIMFQIAEAARKKGYEMQTFSTYLVAKRWISLPPAPKDHTYYGSRLGNAIHRFLAQRTGKNCFYSRFSTWRLIRKLKQFKVDILHLHNLHGGYINLPLLFRFAKEEGIHVIWTLHDCWSFTGGCPHFVMDCCDKWKRGCGSCPQWRTLGAGSDKSNNLWNRKKELFNALKHMTLVTPSLWLASLTRESFLKDFPVKVIHNGIDLSVFKPVAGDFRTKWQCEGKFILLGVSFAWGKRKGLDVFVELAKRLDHRFQIVLIGTDESIQKQLPLNIITIRKTNNQRELAQIYSAADLFVNPTREDTYPTVNMEALACGTPVVTFRTGGSPEILDDTCGSVVDVDDVDAMEKEILRIYAERPYPAEACLKRAKDFDMYSRFEEYVHLYEECMNG